MYLKVGDRELMSAKNHAYDQEHVLHTEFSRLVAGEYMQCDYMLAEAINYRSPQGDQVLARQKKAHALIL